MARGTRLLLQRLSLLAQEIAVQLPPSIKTIAWKCTPAAHKKISCSASDKETHTDVALDELKQTIGILFFWGQHCLGNVIPSPPSSIAKYAMWYTRHWQWLQGIGKCVDSCYKQVLQRDMNDTSLLHLAQPVPIKTLWSDKVRCRLQGQTQCRRKGNK